MKNNNIKILPDNFNAYQFNKKIYHPLQSWQWGEARKEMGIEVLRITDGKNFYQLTFHKLPLTNYKIGYLPRSTLPTKEILKFLADYGRKNNVIFIKIEPYILKKKWDLKFHMLQKSPHPLFPPWTQILNLIKTEDELLKHIHPKTRYNIRLAKKRGVVVKEMTNEKGFKIFSKLYFETCQRQKYFGHNLRYHKIVFKNLKNKIAHILIAFYKNEPLVAYQLWLFKDIGYYVYGGSSDKYRNLMASNLLMWESIRFVKNKKAKKFDMWGSLPPNYSINHPWAGFTRFKQGYGGDFVEMVGSFDLVINQFFYFLYNLAYKIRKIILNL